MFGGQQPTWPQHRLYHFIISPTHHNYFSILLTLLCTHLNNYLYFTHSMKLLWKTEKLWWDRWIHFRRRFESLKTEANFFSILQPKPVPTGPKRPRGRPRKWVGRIYWKDPLSFPRNFLFILSIWSAISNAIYSWVALFFALNCILFLANKRVTSKRNNQSYFMTCLN